MTILAVTSTNWRPDSSLGLHCKVMDGSIVVTAVDGEGIFGGTDLRRGQTILRINGKCVKNIGDPTAGLVDCLMPSGEVTLIVKSKTSSVDGANFKFSTITDQNCRARFNGVMKRQVDDMPQILKNARVPLDSWILIYTLISEELMPVSVKCMQSNDIYNHAMSSSHEKAVHTKGAQTGILHNNVTLIAMAVKDRVSSILAKYSIMAVLAYESIRLPKYPRQLGYNHMMIAVGLDFYPMDCVTACAIPAVPVMVETCQFYRHHNLFHR